MRMENRCKVVGVGKSLACKCFVLVRKALQSGCRRKKPACKFLVLVRNVNLCYLHSRINRHGDATYLTNNVGRSFVGRTIILRLATVHIFTAQGLSLGMFPDALSGTLRRSPSPKGFASIHSGHPTFTRPKLREFGPRTPSNLHLGI